MAGFNLTQSQCDSDNQLADGDDLKLFVDKQSGLGNVLDRLTITPASPATKTSRSTSIAALTGRCQEGNGFSPN